MEFKPVTQKYVFDSNELIRDFPSHLKIPVATWIKGVLQNASIWSNASYRAIDQGFLNELDLHLRETTSFPRDHDNFLPFVLADADRTINVIAICLQNYARLNEARGMEFILSTGGSAYAVIFTNPKPQPYDRGIADIVERVPKVVMEASKEVLDNYALVEEAWHSCYSRNPDYAKTVSKCVDALEGLFKKRYFPADPKPNLNKFLNDFVANPSQLAFHGDSLVIPKNILTDLAKEFTPIRGHHTSGTGRAPTREEAVFVLHYTIFAIQVQS